MDQTVYSFGHMLYEMGAAQMCKTPTIDTCPSPIPAGVGEQKCVFVCILKTFSSNFCTIYQYFFLSFSVAPIIMSILSPKGIKDGLPAISDLLAVS